MDELAEDFAPLTGWHTLDSARDAWVDAPYIDQQLHDLLESAKAQCLAYAPKREDVPVTYRQAQLLQARNLWQAVKKDNNDQVGPDGFAIPVYSLDNVVRGLLRPKRVVRYVG